jgi:quinol monooxygenase YgiN
MSEYLVLITYRMKPGCKERFVDAVTDAGILKAIRAENGCRGYCYFYPAEQADTILLMEEWESKAHQEIHMTQPHMAELMRLKAEYVLETEIRSFETK